MPQIAPKIPQKCHKLPQKCHNLPQNVQKLPQFVLKRPQIAPIVPQIVPNDPIVKNYPTENNFTYLRPSRRRREGRHHRKHILDDPPNMIDPINYVLLFFSIPLFKSFHVACMDNYVLKVTVIYLHLCLVYWFISPCTLSLESGIVSGL